MNKILQLFKMQQSVFNFADLESIFCTDNKQVLKNKIQFLKKKGVLLSPRRGIYILEGKAINHFELANKIYCPSYISFFSALYHHQVIFQYPDEVYLAYKKTQMQNIGTIIVQLKTLKQKILLNPSGIISNGLYSLASAERAFLDTLYLYGDMHFDNLDVIDIQRVSELLPIYESNTLEKRALSYFP